MGVLCGGGGVRCGSGEPSPIGGRGGSSALRSLRAGAAMGSGVELNCGSIPSGIAGMTTQQFGSLQQEFGPVSVLLQQSVDATQGQGSPA